VNGSRNSSKFIYILIDSEAAIRVKCKTKLTGANSLNAVECCQSYGIEIYIGLSNLEGLKSFLNQCNPSIANIFKIKADIWYVHSVIFIKINNNLSELPTITFS